MPNQVSRTETVVATVSQVDAFLIFYSFHIKREVKAE